MPRCVLTGRNQRPATLISKVFGVKRFTAASSREPTLPARSLKVKKIAALPAQNVEKGTELIIRPDPSIYDGRFANNAWLQELPKPLTQLTWDNPVMISLSMSRRLDLRMGRLSNFTFGGRKVTGATWIQPGHPDNALTVFLGYGRQQCGRVGNGVGYNAYQFRTSGALHGGSGVTLRDTGRKYKLITGQGFQDMENRDLVREATLQEYKADAEFAHRKEEEPARETTLYPNFEYTGYAWGMVIDLNVASAATPA